MYGAKFLIMDLKVLIESIGYLGIFAIIFAESGLLLGFFLPGDSLLFTAGFLASQEILSLPVLLIICFVAAVLGDSLGYYIGHKFGRKLFSREDSIFFHKKHVLMSEKFFQKHGAKAVVLARFVPIVRTFVPTIAGIGSMKYATFLRFNIIGGMLWAICIPFAGYFLGTVVPDVDRYLLPIILLIVLASIMPGIIHCVKDAELRAGVMKWFKK